MALEFWFNHFGDPPHPVGNNPFLETSLACWLFVAGGMAAPIPFILGTMIFLRKWFGKPASKTDHSPSVSA
jgi:hypothetical protein